MISCCPCPEIPGVVVGILTLKAETSAIDVLFPLVVRGREGTVGLRVIIDHDTLPVVLSKRLKREPLNNGEGPADPAISSKGLSLGCVAGLRGTGSVLVTMLQIQVDVAP